FFAASAGAAAALIGLLFVAVSVRPETVFGQQARSQNTMMASASFTALLNAFFISLGALIPGANLGIFVVVLGPVAVLNSLALGIDVFRQSEPRARFQSLTLVLVALGLYGYELVNAVTLFRNPGDVSPVYNVAGVLLGVYMYGVARAWQLLGANRRGVLSLIVPWLGNDKPDEAARPHENAAPPVPVATSASSTQTPPSMP
ncbi:MAG: hypothetical protein ACRDHP_17860, partial [Ktedonobacterales bacterium]